MSELMEMMDFWTDDELYENPYSLVNIYNSIRNGKQFSFIKKVYNVDTSSFFGWWIAPYHLVKNDDDYMILRTYPFTFCMKEDKICIKKKFHFQDNDCVTSLEPSIYIDDVYEHNKFALDNRVEHWLYKAGYNSIPLYVTVSCNCKDYNCALSGVYYYNEAEGPTEWYLKPLQNRIPITRIHIHLLIENLFE